MNYSNRLILLSLFSIFVLPTLAKAESFWDFGWLPVTSIGAKEHPITPYLENAKETQNQQWAGEDWYAQDWVAQNKSPMTLVDGFFKADILREQKDDDGVPVIVVGPQFYRLGGFDKRRVMTTVDSVYGMTENPSTPIIKLVDWYTKKDIGIFTKDGLQLE